MPDVPESGEYADVADLPAASPRAEDRDEAQYDVPDDMPLGTPPPVPEGLPVVSLQDIAVMEQKKGGRGIRVKSRRGSTTASHASLSAIPENVPLHPRSELSDSMRVAHAGQPLNRLADVQELEVTLRTLLHVACSPISLAVYSSPSNQWTTLTLQVQCMPAGCAGGGRVADIGSACSCQRAQY